MMSDELLRCPSCGRAFKAADSKYSALHIEHDGARLITVTVFLCRACSLHAVKGDAKGKKAIGRLLAFTTGHSTS